MSKKLQKNNKLMKKIIHFGLIGVCFSLVPIVLALIDCYYIGTTDNMAIEIAPDLSLVASAIVLNAIGVLLSEFDDASHPVFVIFICVNIISACICYFAYGRLINDSYAFAQVVYEIKTEYKEPFDTQVMLAALKQLEDAKNTRIKNHNWIFMIKMSIAIIFINSFIGFIAIPIANRIKAMANPEAIKDMKTPEVKENK